MGRDVAAASYTREQRQRYRDKVHQCLDVFEQMLATSSFDFDEPMTGMEIELNLVDAEYRPRLDNDAVLAAIADPEYQTELARFNIEFNVAPRSLAGSSAVELERDLRASLNEAERRCSALGAHIVMVGILPTVMADTFEGEWMSANVRYQALNDAVLAARGEDIHLDIAGPSGEHLQQFADSLAPESACTSMQLHLQVRPAEFAAHWNAAQVLAGPQLALGANSPYFLGKQLWAETRIELFTQAADTRPVELKNQGVRPRVYFGDRWITSIFDLFEENARFFPAMLPEVDDEDPQAAFNAGWTPKLAEMRLHNGTIYRWNRPIYDIVDGRPHLRVENRPSSTLSPMLRSTMARCGRWSARTVRCGRGWRSGRPRRTSPPGHGTASTPSCSGPDGGSSRPASSCCGNYCRSPSRASPRGGWTRPSATGCWGSSRPAA
jgi:hypothetical protein